MSPTLWHKQALIYISIVEIFRLQCQKPAGMYYIFFPDDENEVLEEMSGLVSSEFFLE